MKYLTRKFLAVTFVIAMMFTLLPSEKMAAATVPEKGVVIEAVGEGGSSYVFPCVTLRWEPVEEATKYRVICHAAGETKWAKMADLKPEAETMSWTHTSAKPNTKYYYAVKAYFGSAGTSLSNKIVYTTNYDGKAVIKSDSIVRTEDGISISWDAVQNLVKPTKYKVIRKLSSETTGWTTVKIVKENGSENYTVTDTDPEIQDDVSYDYAVRTYTMFKNVQYNCLSEKAVVPPVEKELGAPAYIRRGSSTESYARMAWPKITGADGYEIWASDDENGEYELVKKITSYATKAWNDTSVIRGTGRFYKIRAYKGEKVSKFTEPEMIYSVFPYNVRDRYGTEVVCKTGSVYRYADGTAVPYIISKTCVITEDCPMYSEPNGGEFLTTIKSGSVIELGGEERCVAEDNNTYWYLAEISTEDEEIFTGWFSSAFTAKQ